MSEPAATAVARLQDLRLSFLNPGGAVDVLNGVDLEVGPGEFIGVVGESGSGKSLTALSLLDLLPETGVKTSGRIEVLGDSVPGMAAGALQTLRGGVVSMVFQEPMTAFNPVLKIGRQMTETIRRHKGLSPDDAKALSLRLLGEMQIADPARTFESYPHQLSGGMRQRVLLAMAFSADPRLIIADEATTALDVTVQKQILALLKARAKEAGASVLLISHDLAVIAEVCDRVYVMRAGKVVELGATEQVIARPAHPYTQALIAANPSARPSRWSTPATVTSDQPVFELRGATVRYGETAVVKSVSLEVRPGETLGIVGESGSGKTSLLNAIIGLAPLTEGEALLDGRPFAPGARDGKVQVVFQDPRGSLNPRWPVWRIVTEPLTVERRMGAAERKAVAGSLLSQVGLDPGWIERTPAAFSGGQRQRIAIARAIARQPRLLLLDEPTSALDVSAQAQILDLLVDLQARTGLAYIFVSHDLNVIRCVSDRIAVMKTGEIVETGEARQIFDHPAHAYTQTLLGSALSLPVTAAPPPSIGPSS